MKRIVGLDYLRIYTVFVVFLFHAWMHLGCTFGKLTTFVSEGAVLMTLFFMLSGYVLGLKYNKMSLEPIALKKFYVKRLVSILPLYVICAILYPPIFGTEDLIQNLLLFPIELMSMQAFFPSLMNISHNGGTWFVSCIIFCYMMFPLFMSVFSNISHRKLLLIYGFIMVLLLISPWIVYAFQATEIYSNPFIRFLEFVIGMILAIGNESLRRKRCYFWLSNKAIVFASYFAVIVIVMLLVKWQVPHVKYMSYSAILIPLFSCQLLAHTTIVRQSNNHLLKYFADISYAFFLMQLFTFKLTNMITQNLGITDKVIAFLIAFSACLLFAMLGHRIIEQPIAIRFKNIKC